MQIKIDEKNGTKVKAAGRLINWLQTPETIGGKYSSVCTVVYEPHARAKPAHSHLYGEETIYVISGKGKVKVGDEEYEIQPESLVLFPQGVLHMVYNTSDEPLKLICFYGPDQKAIEYLYHEYFDFDEFKRDKF